jgi:hypothetical protein
MVYPVVLGSGKRLFGDESTTLKLAEITPFECGVIALSYQREASA